MTAMQWIAVNTLKPNPRNARTHSRKQIRQIADSITAFGFLVPILIDDGDNIIAGGGRHAAAVLLGLQEVPVIRVEGLSEGKRRALALADNKIAQNAGWDPRAPCERAARTSGASDRGEFGHLDHWVCAGRDRSNRD